LYAFGSSVKLKVKVPVSMPSSFQSPIEVFSVGGDQEDLPLYLTL